MVGSNSEAGATNVMQFLAAIEAKTSEILTTIHGGEYEDEGSVIGTSPVNAKSGSHTKSNLELPSVTTASGEYSTLDQDDGERPLTMQELQKSLREA